MICDDESVGLNKMTMYLTHCRWLILTLVAPEVGVEAFDLGKKFIDYKVKLVFHTNSPDDFLIRGGGDP